MPVNDHRPRTRKLKERGIEHALRHAARGEEVSGEDEGPDCHDLEAVDAGEQLEPGHLRIDAGKDELRKQSILSSWIFYL